MSADDIAQYQKVTERLLRGGLLDAQVDQITVQEAGVLQGFSVDFPWQGTKTSQFRQVGNAVPPAVAEAVLRSLVC